MSCRIEDKYLALSCDLIEEVLSKGGEMSFRISTKSMWPLFVPGDRAVIRKVSASELKFGEPILFKRGDGSIYLHRFLCRAHKDGRRFLVTKGDNEINFDGYIGEADIMGKAIGCSKNGSFLKFDAPFWKLVNRGIACLSLAEGILFSILRWIKRKSYYIMSSRMARVNKFISISFFLCLAFLPASAFSQQAQSREGNKGYLVGGPPKIEPSPIMEEEFWARPLEYYIGAGDSIEISVWGIDELSREIMVRPDGRISYPLIGELDVYGLSMTQLDDELTKRFSVYIRNPQVTVILKKSGGNSIFVLGEVESPGVYKYEGQVRLIEIISKAGGFTDAAVQRSVLVIRGDIRGDRNPQLIKVDAASIYRKARLRNNILLQPNDIVFVPRSFIKNALKFFEDIYYPLTTYLIFRSITE